MRRQKSTGHSPVGRHSGLGRRSIQVPVHLFVYGSLLSTAGGGLGAVERRMLRWNAHLIGRASMAGRMVDLGGYPGAVTGQRRHPRVHGELWHLRHARVLPPLDAYEEIGNATPQYDRAVVWVRLASGHALQIAAWTYLSIEDVVGRACIADGNWARHKAVQG